jgi:hypothetical protein
MKRHLLGLAAILLVITTIGCSFEDILGQLGNVEEEPPVVTEIPRPTQPPEPTEPPEPEPTEPPEPTEAPPTATIVLNNNSGQTICYVNISLSSDTTWGEDQLGSTETIGPGASRTFNVPADTYDLRALDCDEDQIAIEWEVVVSGSYAWNIVTSDVCGLDFSLSPNFGSQSLSAGFSPDPHTETMVSGGEVDVSACGLGSGCTGYATEAPDFRIQWSGSSSRLRIFFVADGGEDTTLVINDPNGDWHCNDDYSGLDPMVEFPNPFTGQYDIWVGSYSSGDYVNGTLYATELDYHPGNLPGEPTEPIVTECDSPATPIQANTTLNLNMHSTSQSYPANCLYYCFAIADAGRLDIGIYNFSVDLDLYVGYGSIEAVDGVVPEWGESYDWMSNDFGTGDEEVTIPNPEAGTYYIEVCSYEGEASPFRLVTSVD